MGDLRSNEIYYHLKCWAKLKRDFASDNASSSKGEAVSDNLKFKRNFCLRKVQHDVYDSLHENPSQLIELREVFKKFEELCSDNHLDIYMNITRFKDELQKIISDDSEIVKSGKLLYTGFKKDIKEAATSCLKSKKSFCEQLGEI